MVSQQKYILDLLKEMSRCKPQTHQLIQIRSWEISEWGDLAKAAHYQRLVGKLIYLSHTQPDIAFDVSFVSVYALSTWRASISCLSDSNPREGLFFKKREQQKNETHTNAN